MYFKIYRYYFEDVILCSKYVDLYGLKLNFDIKFKILCCIFGIK